MRRDCSCRQEEASGQQIESRPATHLALQHLQAIDLPFARPLTPGQRHPGLDSGVISAQSFGNAPEGRESARAGARQPRIELGRLALADEGGEVLRERHRLCQLGRLLGKLRQLVVILIRRPLRRTKDQPGSPTRGEQASSSFSHRPAAAERCAVARGPTPAPGACV
jgi:hypothetical protein